MIAVYVCLGLLVAAVVLYQFLLPTCPCCCRRVFRGDILDRPRNTVYEDDDLNRLVSCSECYQQDCDYYDELWRDYYNSR